ncbi:WD40 repeat protein [Azospirillum agricola]|uniref:caspase family protein n=1 Tax=Azospirillum agricola TaxID=1720247 RepID=UPI001AE68806|nr:caspase family protein [Azospirillum agricola]MBP2230032.1 WD40 repeat protein [Azospirillum agricola]
MPALLPRLLALLAALLLSGQAMAADPPSDPILRVETGEHTAIIWRIGVDAAATRLLTVSEDKTARLWSLPEGRLIRIFRPPITSDAENNLYSGALSPDGRTVAVGGYDGNNESSVYLFNANNGTLIRRLGGLSNVIKHITFSLDGRRLAVSIGGSNGILVWDIASGREVIIDRDYGGDAYGLTFATDGRLATTSLDGYVRLYSQDGRLLRKVRAPAAEQPFSIVFSPDSGRLAVGYNDLKRVSVLSAIDLSLLYSPDTTGGSDGNLSSVQWSADGRFLFAGGMWDKNGKVFIRRWSDGGRGAATDLAAPTDSTIMDLQPWGLDGVLFGAGDPAFGALDARGRTVLSRLSAVANMRDKLSSLLVSRDGRRVRFGLRYGDGDPVLFDLAARTLEPSIAVPSGLVPPRVTGLPVTDWKDDAAPKLGGTVLPLKQYEWSRSLAISSAADRFLLGAEWSLRLFDRTGAQLWGRPSPGSALGVNISGDGRMGVVAYGGGTIRWHRMTDGKELLALFVHASDRRWVAWTPSGYYMASAGGEDLIGWHVNNGKDAAADFFGAGRFRDRFNRPDVVQRILTTLDEAAALREADAEAGRRTRTESDVRRALPPVTAILSPADGAEVTGATVTVRYTVRSPSGAPITAVRARVDNRPAEVPRGQARIDPAAGEGTLEVVLPAACPDSGGTPRADRAGCTHAISVSAETRDGVGEAATVLVRRRNAGPLAGADLLKPKLYVLAVGVGQYADPALKLEFAGKDARDFAAALKTQSGRLYGEVIVKPLIDRDATRDAVIDGLDWLQRQTTARDMAVLFLSGHGMDDNNGDYYFLPSDADAANPRRRGVPNSEIQKTLRDIGGKALAFLDTCHSGNALGGRKGAPVDVDRLANELASHENGSVVFMSSLGRQYSLEDPRWNNGAFTKALVEGLSGKASLVRRDGTVSVDELSAYVADRVKELTGGRQTPNTLKSPNTPNYTIAVTP